MGVRIILVSVVAVLGLTFPSVDRVGEWQTAAQGWVNERLAEWDAQMPVDQDAFVIVAESPVTTLTTPAIVATESTELEPQATVAPVVVASEGLAAGLDAPTSPVDLGETEPASLTEVAVVSPASDPGFVMAQEEFVSAYRVEVAAAEVRRDAITLANLAAELDFARNYVSAESEADPSLVSQSVETLDVVETLKVDGSVDEGIAYELSQYAEGLEYTRLATAQQEEEPTPSSSRERRLTTAVRLTREAVHAWATLLHGPAIASIGD